MNLVSIFSCLISKQIGNEVDLDFLLCVSYANIPFISPFVR